MAAQTSTRYVAAKPISLKALVDREKNRVVFVESNKVFIDILFSFLTMPMGRIIRLIRNQPAAIEIGCMNNIYASAENLDPTSLRSHYCKKMLLHPKNSAAVHCSGLKVNIDGSEYSGYYCCQDTSCSNALMSHYYNVLCRCSKPMNRHVPLTSYLYARDGGGFVKEQAQYLVSDKLQVMPLSTAATVALLSEFGITDDSVIEERTFDIGPDEVWKLLKCSLASETPLTEALLQHKPVSELNNQDFEDGSIKHQNEEHESKGSKKISVRLLLSKSERTLCYAEVNEDFVDLLLSFLTIPLGCIVKEINFCCSNGSINHLYKSVQDLDALRHLKSNFHRDILLSPKIAPGFGYPNHPLGLKESSTGYNLTLMDPKSYENNATKAEEFVLKPGMFMVTDNLIITPLSSLSILSTLKKLKVPFSDIEERVELIGKAEAWRLLVGCFTSQSPLTDTFIRKESNVSDIFKVPKQEC